MNRSRVFLGVLFAGLWIGGIALAQQQTMPVPATQLPLTAQIPASQPIPAATLPGSIPPGPRPSGPGSFPTTGPSPFKPFVTADVHRRQVRVACESLKVDIPLEFFCVMAGGPEHESVLRTRARPSDIHLALLMIGLKPGEPMHYMEQEQQWMPPTGPALRISVEFPRDQKMQILPATAMMRHVQSHEPMPEMRWVFAGSRISDSGNYVADVTGYVVSLVNFDYTMIDVPELASNSNETLQWELNPDLLPVRGTPVTMIIEPAENPATLPSTTQVATTHPGTNPAEDKVQMLLIAINAAGQIEYEHVPFSVTRLPEFIAKRQERGPISVRLLIHPDAPDEAVTAARSTLTATGTPVQIIPWHTAGPTTAPSPVQPVAPSNAPATSPS